MCGARRSRTPLRRRVNSQRRSTAAYGGYSIDLSLQALSASKTEQRKSLPISYAMMRPMTHRRIGHGVTPVSIMSVAAHAGETCGVRRRSGDRYAAPFGLHHMIKFRRVSRGKTDAAMRRRASQRAGFVAAVNGVAPSEKNRMRHRRHVIFARIMHSLHSRRRKAAARRVIA